MGNAQPVIGLGIQNVRVTLQIEQRVIRVGLFVRFDERQIVRDRSNRDMLLVFEGDCAFLWNPSKVPDLAAQATQDGLLLGAGDFRTKPDDEFTGNGVDRMCGLFVRRGVVGWVRGCLRVSGRAN